MPFVTTNGRRINRPTSDPEGMPFSLTRDEEAFAVALSRAKTEEALAEAFRNHLGSAFAQQMVAGYAEALPDPTVLAGHTGDEPTVRSHLPLTRPTYGRRAMRPDFTSTDVRKEVDVRAVFGMANDDAIRYAETRVGHLIVNAVDMTREGIREALAYIFGADLELPGDLGTLPESPGMLAETEEFIRRVSAIPLPARTLDHLVSIAAKMRAERDALDEFGFPKYTEAERGAMAERDRATWDAMYDRTVVSRSRLIARTETQFALNFGKYNGWLRAVMEGLVDPSVAGKRWVIGPEVSRRGKRVCPTCQWIADNRPVVRLYEPFLSGSRHGDVLVPPLHPACRCTAVLIPDLEAAGFGGEVGPYAPAEVVPELVG